MAPRIFLKKLVADVLDRIDLHSDFDPRRVAYAQASDQMGRSRWKGEGQGLSFRLCQAIKRVLATDDHRDFWSRRATEWLREIRQDDAWLDGDSTAILVEPDGAARWWTFAGAGANATLVSALSQFTHSRIEHDSLALNFECHLATNEIEHALAQLRDYDISEIRPEVDERTIDGLKFSECLPTSFAMRILQCRFRDLAGTQQVLQQPLRVVAASGNGV